MRMEGTLRTGSSREIDGSRWGLMFNVPEPADLTEMVTRYADTGATWAPFDLGWEAVEVEREEYDFSTYDPVVEALLDAGISPAPRLGLTHREYADGPEQAPAEEPAYRDALAEYMHALAAHYEGISHWNVYREPNFPTTSGVDEPRFPTREDYIWPFRRGETRMTPTGYADVVEIVSEAIRSAQPDARIHAGSLWASHPDMGYLSYTREFLSSVDTDAFDAYGVHVYRHTPEHAIDTIDEIREVVNEHDSTIDIRHSEGGMPSRGDTMGYRTGGPWSPRIQAKWVLRRFASDALADVEASAYYKLADSESRGYDEDTPLVLYERTRGINAKGLLFHPDGDPKPGHAAFANFTTLLDGDSTPVEVEAGMSVREIGSFHGIGGRDDRFPLNPYYLGYDGEAGGRLLYWLPWRLQERVDPATVDLEIDSPAIEDPVVVDLLSGSVSEPAVDAEGTLLGLPLTDYPKAVVDRGGIETASE